jgi:hypothetical protein
MSTHICKTRSRYLCKIPFFTSLNIFVNRAIFAVSTAITRAVSSTYTSLPRVFLLDNYYSCGHINLTFHSLIKKEDAMSISVLRSARWVFSVMAVTVFSALVLVGCGKDDDEPSLDSKLICADDEGWTGTTTQDGAHEVAVILKRDGSLVLALEWDGIWYQFGTGTWSTNGSNITIITNAGSTTETIKSVYTVSGDGKTATMTINGGKQDLKKTNGITVIIDKGKVSF